MINTRLSVAIHILTLISDNSKRSSKEIAESVNTNPVVIRRISSDLKKAGILTSKVGTKGYSLARKAKEITLLDIYKALELENTLFSIHENPNPDCNVGKHIQTALNTTFESIQLSLEKDLAATSLQDFLNDFPIN